MVAWLQGGHYQFLLTLDMCATPSPTGNAPFLEPELALVTQAGASDLLGLLRLNPMLLPGTL